MNNIKQVIISKLEKEIAKTMDEFEEQRNYLKECKKQIAIVKKLRTRRWKSVQKVNLVEGKHYIIRRVYGKYSYFRGTNEKPLLAMWNCGWKLPAVGLGSQLSSGHAVDDSVQVLC